MKKEPLVSVIMNCYNGEEYLREAIDSVFEQRYANWEIIFWDNASTDRTGQIATSYGPRVKYYRAEVNTPLGPARNMALKKATGEYIAFLDSDDVYLPDTLQKQINLIRAGGFGLVYGGAIIIDKDGAEIRRNKARYSSGHILESLLKRYDITMGSVMVRTSVIHDGGLGFNEGMGYCPDYNLFMKIAAQYPVGVIHEPIFKYRRSPGALSKRTLHLVSKEIGQTLNELQQLYPDVLKRCDAAVMETARSRLNFYDAVNQISLGNYAAAREALKPVIRERWEYMAVFLILFLPVSKTWLLRVLNR